jgi:DNA repair protein RecO (recombination protein O)
MPPFSTEAIILKTVDFGERDRLITFYSDDLGKMKGVAKSAKQSRRRFGANLDLLAHVRVHGFQRRSTDLVRVDGADILHHFKGMRTDLRAFARGCYLAEWVEHCTVAHEPLPGLVPLLLAVLRGLDSGHGREDLLRIFEIKVLDMAGFGPQLVCCVNCGRRWDQRFAEIAVEAARGGAVCSDCLGGRSKGQPVSLGTIRILEDARRVHPDHLHRIAFSSRALGESRQLLRAFYAYYVGRALRSALFLEEVDASQSA